jgi:hypothetical protein
MSAEAALAICKAEWADARLRYAGPDVDPSTLKLVRATDAFLVSHHALDAFKGGWTLEQLFGLGRGEHATEWGLICLAARGIIEIVRFDESRVWIRVPNAPGAGATPVSYRPKDFPVSNGRPWWQDDVPLAN